MHDHRRLYRWIARSSAFRRELHKYLPEMPQSPTTLQTDTAIGISQRVAKIFTRNATITATITDDSTNEYILSEFYKELQKYLLEMSSSPTSLQTNTAHWYLSAQFTTTDRLANGRCEFQMAGINASLTTCICRRIAKILEGHLKFLVWNSKFTDGFCKIHRQNN